MQSMLQKVEEEIRQLREKRGSCVNLNYFLGNFMCHMPNVKNKLGGYRRDWFKDRWEICFRDIQRENIKELKVELRRDYRHIFFGQELEDFIKMGVESVQPYSELLQTQTPKEFYAAVDKSVSDCGIDIRQFSLFQEQGKNYIKLNARIFPSYIRLREVGYNHYPDLTQ
jgi:hypothetical protein